MSAPWRGRRLHFVGVGGAGMSAYARAAHALGAQVSGSDRADSPYLARLRADGVLDASIGHDAANVPAGTDVEVVYSSAVPSESPERAAARERGLRERPRAELLGELSALKRTIAVAGTHGKTTTAAMLVHILRNAGLEPAWLVGAPVGGGLANGEWSEGEWLVVEADESDRSMLALDVEVAVLTNVELDHHASFASLVELRAAFRAFLALARTAVVAWDRPELIALAPEARAVPVPEARAVAATEGGHGERAEAGRGLQIVPYDVPNPTLTAGGSRFRWREHEVALAVPGAHNALNAAAALEAARLAGADSERAIGALATFAGAGRRFQLVGTTAGGASVYDDYAHHPTEVAATLSAARTLAPRRLVAVFQPHLYSRTALLAREFGTALALADVVVVLDVYPARERAGDHPGVSGLTIAQAAADAAGGRTVMWLPTFNDALPVLRGLLSEGDLCMVMGAGDVDTLARRLAGGVGEPETPAGQHGGRAEHTGPPSGRASGRAPMKPLPPPLVQRDFALARLTTVRTGGAAELFARIGSEAQLLELLAWARDAQAPVAVVGSGSNLLVADEGVHGLVLKLEGELAAIERVGERGLLCGGGARLPAVAAYAARAGMAGIEFGVNIPGTVGGAVRMNANAYGGELARTLEWVEAACARDTDPDGARLEQRVPADLGFAYRSSNLRPGEVVARALFALHSAPPAEVKARLADLRARRHEAQPQGIKTFGSTFKNPDERSETDRLAGGRTAGLLLAEAGCNGLAVGGARYAPKHANFIENTGGATTAEIVALIAEGRRRVLERFGVALEPEVQTLGPVRFPWM